jgi:hypothetical protein
MQMTGVKRIWRWYRQVDAVFAASVAATLLLPRNTDPVIPARRLVVLLLLALSGALLAACGGGSDKPQSAEAILKDTFGPGKSIKSGNLGISLGLNAVGLQGLGGPVKLSLKGPFQSQGGDKLPLFDFDLGLTSGGTTFSAGAISTGKAGFLKFQGTSYALTASTFDQFKKGYEASAKDTGKKGSQTSLSKLGVDPLRWLDDPQKLDTAEVGGAETNHVTATVDVPNMLADVDTLLRKAGSVGGQAAAGVPKGLTAAQRKQITDAVQKATFDVWAGKDDGILRKLDIKVAFAVPKADQAAAGGLQKGTLQITLTIADLNKDQTITAPKSSKPLSDLQSQIQGLLGAATGAATGGGTGTTPDASGGTATTPAPSTGTGTGTAPSAATQSAYVECLQAAGADIAKVNACAKLLEK